MAGGDLLVDRFVAGGFLRPAVLLLDAVPWGPNDPQEDELGLARLSIDSNMAGMAFPLAYSWFFRRNVLGSSAAFERQ